MDREQQLKDLVAQFPDSPMGYFSLGRHYLDARRYRDAIPMLERCNALQADYAAALVALADAYAGAGQPDAARRTFGQAREVALAQKHPSLADEIDERVRDL